MRVGVEGRVEKVASYTIRRRWAGGSIGAVARWQQVAGRGGWDRFWRRRGGCGIGWVVGGGGVRGEESWSRSGGVGVGDGLISVDAQQARRVGGPFLAAGVVPCSADATDRLAERADNKGTQGWDGR